MSDGPARRIASPAWLRQPAMAALLDTLGEARFVGGAVRDTLLGLPPGDLDLATPLEPIETLARLERVGIRTVPTGLSHGTITAILADDTVVEVTTLRRDVETDGRHAIVAFTHDWAADAARRDFTLNALYLDRSGGIWDPVGGLDDCLAGRIRFVGAPLQRIDEDVLRILRFYRFQARYGRGTPDAEARAACRRRADRIDRLAGERLQTETRKLLGATDPTPTARLMTEDGVLAAYLPGPFHLDRLAALVPIEPSADPIRRLAALLDTGAGTAVAERLRLSSTDRDRLVALTGTNAIDLAAGDRSQRTALYRLGVGFYRDFTLLAAAGRGQPERARPLLALADAWDNPALPIGGRDVTALGIEAGPAVGRLLRLVEEWWIEGDFRADRAACLDRLTELAALAQA
ncbi:MAG TPA: CCA tRNA nucleotidyltransferase [Aliidongia sp.]|uniref:CCA tRNA nucleotidyltransferase n=1 Tax=Aliidongia sp. TaxID=1914230 RepID=UPI002DDD7464|nr:CCA tRNA nucleotidyltransferase [Aliidongia sp.]HEV2677852.1 CCA tRNA nucleotidyltransferase [Aliidongia sp.]